MKNFEDYTKNEKATIIKNGGIKKRDLEKAFKKWFFENEDYISNDVIDILNASDPVLDIYGICDTVEELIDLAHSYMQED